MGNKQLTKEDILCFLREHKEELREKYGLTKIGLFGSYANGCSTDKSDIDVYAEFEERKFKYIAGTWTFLEKNLEKKVDLFYPHKNMRKALKDTIEKETIYG